MAISLGSTKLLQGASMSASFQSDSIPLVGKRGFSIHARFTGSPNGSLYISVSTNNSDWIVLSNSSQSISAAGDVFFNVKETQYFYAKLQWAFTSGSGSLDADFNVKEAA